MYFIHVKAKMNFHFHQPLLQSSLSHDPSEIKMVWCCFIFLFSRLL